MAQIKDPGKLKTNSGYVKNTNPGPDRATSSTVAPCKWAMWPKMEKTKTPAVKQVQVLTMQVMMASLKKSGKIQTVNTFHNCTFFLSNTDQSHRKSISNYHKNSNTQYVNHQFID